MNHTEQNISTTKEDDEIELIELFRVFWEHKLIIIITIAIFTAGSVIYAMRLPNIYTAEVTLVPVSSDGSVVSGGLGAFGGLASLAGMSTSGGGAAANIAVIKSRKFIMEFITENNLLPILFPKKWDSENIKWLGEDKKVIPTLQQGYTRFTKDILSISKNSKNGLIILKVSWYDPELSAKWANMLVGKANEFLKHKAISEANQSIAYLKDQISSTREVGIQELLYKLIEKELKTTKLANVRKDYAFQILDPALVPERKSKPIRTFLVAIGGMLGVVASVILLVCKLFFYRFKKVQ